MPTTYSEISKYWNDNPCAGGSPTFAFNSAEGTKVLEVGCGAGVDAEKFVNFGAVYTGIDLTDKAVELTKLKIGHKGRVLKMNAEQLVFPDNHFDLVYSWGVIHHAVNPEQVVNEIYRVLKPGGLFFFMLYHKHSFKYSVEIMFFRKILWILHHPKYRELRKQTPHPTHDQWVSWNTDNLGCPLSKVYMIEEVIELTKSFPKLHIFTNTSWFMQGWARK